MLGIQLFLFLPNLRHRVMWCSGEVIEPFYIPPIYSQKLKHNIEISKPSIHIKS